MNAADYEATEKSAAELETIHHVKMRGASNHRFVLTHTDLIKPGDFTACVSKH